MSRVKVNDMVPGWTGICCSNVGSTWFSGVFHALPSMRTVASSYRSVHTVSFTRAHFRISEG